SEHSWVLLNELKSDYYGDLFIMYRNNSMPDELFQEAIKHQPKVCSNNGMSAYHGYINANFFYPSPSEKLSIFQEEVMPSITDPVEKNRLEDFLQVYQDMVEKKEYDKKTFASESKYFNDQYKELVNDASTALFVSKTKQLSPEKADIVLILGGSEDIWERDRYVKNILPEINNDWCANVLKKEWDKTKKHIAMVNKKLEAIEVSTNTNPIGASQGKLSSGGELILAEQENVDNLLASIRAKYPNKAILLDVWATWCGPCIHDMKTSAENIEKLRAMDVEVVYVCVEEGSDAEKWQKKVAELDLNTTHVFLDKKLSGEIMEYFDLRGYPSHLFINKKGKYIRDLVHSISRADLDKVKKKVN
ncbi:MAG: TlpA disulfide reductase family protein, partial [Bacteroidota bacterium]